MNIACKDCVKWNKGCMGEEDYINPHECSYGYEDVSLLSNRIADALEKIARELEKQNKLKVAEMPTDSYDGIPLKRGGKIVTSNLMKLTR